MTTTPAALRCAEHLDALDKHVLKSGTLKPCADLLRAQHAALERKDALLRQCLDSLRAADAGFAVHPSVFSILTRELAK